LNFGRKFLTSSILKTIRPYKDQAASKKEQIAGMFNAIARQYDFMNHFLSFGIDKYWRNKAINVLNEQPVRKILDIATGTADFAIKAAKKTKAHVDGIDISENMLELGRKKILKKKLQEYISLSVGDAESLQYPDKTFDAVIVAFGVRNFENLNLGLTEMYRVIKSHGTVIILEFSRPTIFPLKQFYSFYFKTVLPLFGKLISKDKSAYSYLPESVYNFPDGDTFISELKKAGFSNCQTKKLTFGIASIYIGRKN
jgi:demethylmenaquinone methyltransferase/2-methoxy-6-polyprenyl-1,4-benzoquinol methylase